MAVTPITLVQGVLLSTSASAIYPAGASVQITSATFTNTDTAAHVITVNLARASLAAGAANAIVSAQTLAPGMSWTAPQLSGRNLASGDAIVAVADAAGVVNAIIDGFSY